MVNAIVDRPADNRVAVPTGAPPKGRIAVLTADVVEDVEFFYPYYRFTEAGYEVDVITPSGGELTAARGMKLLETVALAEVDPADYLMLFVPGGHAPLQLRTLPAALDFVRAFATADKPVGLVCHGPQVLVSAGLAGGRRMTSWYGVAEEIETAGGTWVNEAVIHDGPFFTDRKPGDLPAEMHAIIEHLDQRSQTAGATGV
ncbi:type 1 glutamine amidotransferase domain-containing protein [Streptomyces sp. Ag109_O5-10]|uniref:type 1 glutamine amidotransferase domain-containing protein n=1 Tax=Streptomyces sp. Ag109_O5-10 TaxID=1855349 RepID=UPI00089C7BB5|nr:type 1 glutamine amidotransferase domain-containing protein [Streptomyces sp. Ag109_O5-10]SED64462.1 protease I [Streptomyces sp. Ag109_O5-10]